jgi:membrane-associated phospholipid phosphatase
MMRVFRTIVFALAVLAATCGPTWAQPGPAVTVEMSRIGASLVAAPPQAPAAGVRQVGHADESFCGGAPDVRGKASWDVRGLRAVYCTSSRPVVAGLVAAHRSARPVFYGGVPAAWAGALLARGPEGNLTDAYRLTVTQVVTYGLTAGLKRIVGRPRPYVTRPLRSRSSHYADPEAAQAYHSFPSGHASLSVGLATSWSLSHPRWYVVAPSALWASAVAVSRLHRGVHYPSDVLAGALLGGAVATAVHLLRRSLTPDRFTSGTSPAPAIGLTVRL